jgi:hypothetical protein
VITLDRAYARGRRTLALLMLASVLLVGSAQSPATAGSCVPAPPTQRPAADLASTAPGTRGIESTRIHWVRWHKRVVYGGAATLDGQVVTEDGAVANATVDLFVRDAGAEDWTHTQSATTDPETGVFSFSCLEPTVTTEYRAVYHGNLYFGASQGTRKVGVARRVPDAMRKVATQRFRFSGSVEPSYRQRPVLLQRKDCPTCRWRTVTRKVTTDRSRWSFALDTSTFSGRRWFRAVVPADEQHVRSVSDRAWRLAGHHS